MLCTFEIYSIIPVREISLQRQLKQFVTKYRNLAALFMTLNQPLHNRQLKCHKSHANALQLAMADKILSGKTLYHLIFSMHTTFSGITE